MINVLLLDESKYWNIDTYKCVTAAQQNSDTESMTRGEWSGEKRMRRTLKPCADSRDYIYYK